MDSELPVHEKAAAPSVAVLPFTDLSPDRDQGYFCDGIAEEVIDALVRMGGLQVAPRTSTFHIEASAGDPRALGERLGVAAILEGSVRKDGKRLRITVRLTDVADGYCRWSERFDRELEDVFTLQEEIAASTVQALQGVLSDENYAVPVRRVDLEAYDYYLRGRRYFYRQSKRDHEFARQLFVRAIEVDPTFARAHAGLSDCCLLLYKHFDRRPEYLEQAGEASLKAVELAPELGETHAARGLYLSLSGADEEAELEFEAAVHVGPRRYEAYYLYGVHQLYLKGDLARAAELFGQAAAVQAGDYQALLLQAACYRGSRRDEEAAISYRRGLQLAQRHLELNPDDVRAIYLSANAMVALGEQAQGLEWAARALALSPTPSSVVLYNVAAIHALAGDRERGLDFLERAVQAGYRQREAIENDPDFQALRGHPRYQGLLRNRFLNREARPGSEASLTEELTRREREVLDLVAQGLSNDEIAGRLHIEAKTVRNHVTHLFSKMGVTRRAAAIVQAREAGFGRETR